MAEISCGVYLPAIDVLPVGIIVSLIYFICHSRGFGAYLRKTVAHKSFDGCHGPLWVGDRLTFGGISYFAFAVIQNATTDGVVLLPSSLGITTGSLPSITATHELVVPRSIPIIFPIVFVLVFVSFLLSIDVPCRFYAFYCLFLLKSCQ